MILNTLIIIFSPYFGFGIPLSNLPITTPLIFLSYLKNSYIKLSRIYLYSGSILFFLLILSLCRLDGFLISRLRFTLLVIFYFININYALSIPNLNIKKSKLTFLYQRTINIFLFLSLGSYFISYFTGDWILHLVYNIFNINGLYDLNINHVEPPSLKSLTRLTAPMAEGGLLAENLLFCYLWVLFDKKSRFNIFLIFLTIIGMVLTKSGVSIFLLIINTSIYLISKFNNSYKIKNKTFLLIPLIIISIFLPLILYISFEINNFSRIESGGILRIYSFLERYYSIKDSFDVIINSNIYSILFGQNVDAMDFMRQIRGNPNIFNNYLELIFKIGLFPTFIFLSFTIMKLKLLDLNLPVILGIFSLFLQSIYSAIDINLFPFISISIFSISFNKKTQLIQ